MAQDIVFLDTETLGLHPDAPVWEFAAVRRFASGGEDRTEFRIQHDPITKHGMTPAWHYRPLCVTTMAVGWLHGVAAREIDAAEEWGESPDPALVNRDLPVPWSSDEVSRAVGVDPTLFPRHTAMGDVLWAAAQWDIITGVAGRPVS